MKRVWSDRLWFLMAVVGLVLSLQTGNHALVALWGANLALIYLNMGEE